MARKNVFDNVAFPLLEVWKTPAQERKRRVLELLDWQAFTDKAYQRRKPFRRAKTARGAACQALVFPAAFCCVMKLLSALDPRTTITILELLENIRKSLDLTIIMVTHQMEVVKRMCNRILLLDGGECQGLGQTETFFPCPHPQPENPY